VHSVIDIGSTQGCVPVQFALAHPHLTLSGLDLPAADNDQLPSADVLIMGHMIHGWDLPTKMNLLEKAYSALPPGGSLIVYEMLIDDERRTHLPGLLMSLNMLIETRGGFDFTAADCISWMREVGFSGARKVSLTGPSSAVIGTK
jgi:hypothetical protein